MTLKHFSLQIQRLKNAFGEKSYVDEKTQLIWQVVKDLSEEWFSKSISNLIANSRHAPLPVDIMELARIEKNMPIRFPTAKEITPIEGSVFSKEEISEIFSMMQKRIKKQISAQELGAYGQMIQSVIDHKPKCKQCDDGVVFESRDAHSGPSVFKCTCMLGRRRLENWPIHQGQILRITPPRNNLNDDDSPGAA